MKKLYLILLLLLSSCLPALAQSHWFTPLNFGLLPLGSTGRYDDIYFTGKDTGLLVSSYGMIFKTYDGAQHWHLKNVVSPSSSSWESNYFRSVECSSDGQTAIAGTLSGRVFRSSDRGETWADISSSISDTNISDGKRICGLAHFGNTFYGVGWWGGTKARIYKSADGGLTWATKYIDPSLATGLVDVVFLSATKGFATGCKGDSYHPAESVVLRTLDGGDTWTKVFSDTTIGGRIWKIQFLDSTWGVGSVEPVYCDTVAMIKTTDGGDTWHIYPVGTTAGWAHPYSLCQTQGIGFINKQKGWMGGYYNGMFETSDGGLTWDTLNTNSECDRFFLVDNTMYVSANTVYKYTGAGNVAVNAPLQPTFVHKLYPINPNPAHGIVTIEFDINVHQTNTVLQVVNTDGRKTYQVTNGYLKPGHYTYTWDGTKALAGNYIIWLGTDEIPMVQKFVLTK